MYLDTAILVKLFVAEPDSEFFGRMVDGQPVCSSAIAYTELWSALLGKERAGTIETQQRVRAWVAFRRNVEEEFIRLEPLSEAQGGASLAGCTAPCRLRSTAGVAAVHDGRADAPGGGSAPFSAVAAACVRLNRRYRRDRRMDYTAPRIPSPCAAGAAGRGRRGRGHSVAAAVVTFVAYAADYSL